MASLEEDFLQNYEYGYGDIDEIHYVWISHGTSLSQSRQKYKPTDIKQFNNKIYQYAGHDKTLNEDHPLLQIMFDQSKGKIYNHLTSQGPVVNKEINKEYFISNGLESAHIKPSSADQELWPLKFDSGGENELLSRYMGLYRIISYGGDNLNIEQKMDVNDQLKEHQKKGGASLLYSDVFKYIKDDIKFIKTEYIKEFPIDKNITLDKFINDKIKSISLFSCSYIDNKYRQYFTGISQTTNYGTCAQDNIINMNINPYIINPNKINFQPFQQNLMIYCNNYDPTTLPSNWEPLATRTDRGCGINLLTYFSIILPETENLKYKTNVGRGTVGCLPSTGQTTWNFLRYILNFYVKKGFKPPQFSIVRMEVKYGLFLVIHNLALHISKFGVDGVNKVAFVKLLGKNKHGEKISNVGHFIGLSFRQDTPGGQINFVHYDPQNFETGYVIHPSAKGGNTSPLYYLQLANHLYNYYNQQFNFVDLILTNTDIPLLWVSVQNFPIDTPDVINKNFKKTDYSFYYENTDILYNGYIQYKPRTDGGWDINENMINKLEKNSHLPLQNQVSYQQQQMKNYIESEYRKIINYSGNSTFNDRGINDIYNLNQQYHILEDKSKLHEIYHKLPSKNEILSHYSRKKYDEIYRIIKDSGILNAAMNITSGGKKNKKTKGKINKRTKRKNNK